MQRSSRDLFRMTIEEFQAACEAYDGFCTACNDITNCGVEPDARRYECDPAATAPSTAWRKRS